MMNISLVRADMSGIWVLPGTYTWENVEHLYLDNEEIFEGQDYVLLDDHTADVIHTKELSYVSADVTVS